MAVEGGNGDKVKSKEKGGRGAPVPRLRGMNEDWVRVARAHVGRQVDTEPGQKQLKKKHFVYCEGLMA